MREFLYRVALTILLIAYFCLILRNVHCEEKPITLAVLHRVLIVSVKGTATVKVTWRIPRNLDNRYFSLAWISSEGESGSTFRDMDEKSPITYEKFINVTQGAYVFEACVYNQKKICVREDVEVQ